MREIWMKTKKSLFAGKSAKKTVWILLFPKSNNSGSQNQNNDYIPVCVLSRSFSLGGLILSSKTSQSIYYNSVSKKTFLKDLLVVKVAWLDHFLLERRFDLIFLCSGLFMSQLCFIVGSCFHHADASASVRWHPRVKPVEERAIQTVLGPHTQNRVGFLITKEIRLFQRDSCFLRDKATSWLSFGIVSMVIACNFKPLCITASFMSLHFCHIFFWEAK